MSEIDNVIEHYGVKGMKWGIRRSRKARRRAAKKRAKKMSDSDLRAKVNRLNMEKQYVDLSVGKAKGPSRLNRGAKAVGRILLSAGTKSLKGYTKTVFTAKLNEWDPFNAIKKKK